MKFIIKVALLALVLIVGYNYFMGTTTEKESSQKIIDNIKELSNSVKDLVITEKDKYDEGKYDDVIDKISQQFKELEKVVSGLTKEEKSEINTKVENLKNDINEMQQNEEANEQDSSFSSKMQKLLDKLEELESKINENSNTEK